MIQINSKRDSAAMPVRVVDAGEALKLLVQYELGYGGELTVVAPTAVAVRTVVLGCVDVTTFVPTDVDNLESMKLIQTAAIYHQACILALDKSGESGPFSEHEIKVITERSGGNPRLISMGAGMFVGAARAKRVYILLMEPESEEVMKTLAQKSLTDLHELVCFKHIEKIDTAMLNELIYA